jgi:hypothetical protein
MVDPASTDERLAPSQFSALIGTDETAVWESVRFKEFIGDIQGRCFIVSQKDP